MRGLLYLHLPAKVILTTSIKRSGISVPRFFLFHKHGGRRNLLYLGLKYKMKNMLNLKTLFFQFFCLCCSVFGTAQNVRLNNCYVTHNDYNYYLGAYPDSHAPCGMTFHLNFNVHGYKGKDIWCIIEMAYYEGNESYYFPMARKDYSYNGHLAACKKLAPGYDNSLYEDLQVFLPHSEITASIGKSDGWSDWCKDITYCITLIDLDGNILFKEWQTNTKLCFSQRYNKPQDCSGCKGSRVCNQCYGNGVVWIVTTWMRCIHCNGTGVCPLCKKGGPCEPWALSSRSSFEPRPSNNNYQPSYNLPNSNVTSGRCPICYGSGKCPTCAGRGEKSHYNRHTNINEWTDCGVCNGTGRCWACKGSGKE